MWEVFGAALALGLGYAMLLAVPIVPQHLRTTVHAGAGLGRIGMSVLSLGAMGLALAGSAALILALVQLAAEVRKHPYAFLSPLLAAFCACMLIGLGARLPLPGIASEYVALCALTVAVAGGALLADERPAMQIVGVLLALFPAVTLLIMVWVTTGKGDPAAALWSLPPAAMSFVVLLLVSSFAIASLAMVVHGIEQAGPAAPGPVTASVARPEHAAVASVPSITPLGLAVTARLDTPSGPRPISHAVYRALPPLPPPPAPRAKPSLRLVRNATIAVLSASLLVAIGRALAGPPVPPPAPAEINLRTKPISAPVVSAVAATVSSTVVPLIEVGTARVSFTEDLDVARRPHPHVEERAGASGRPRTIRRIPPSAVRSDR